MEFLQGLDMISMMGIGFAVAASGFGLWWILKKKKTKTEENLDK